jgi:mono/diheme cytochrome c family protein
MNRTPFIVFGIFAAICVLGLPIWALASKGGEDAGTVDVASQDRASQELFETNCGPCHTLAAGGTDGVVGPNLDELLITSGSNTPEMYSSLYTRVIHAVNCGISGRMPKGILIADDAKAVAQFVAAYAGQIGHGPTVDTSDPKQAPTPEPEPCGG